MLEFKLPQREGDRQLTYLGDKHCQGFGDHCFEIWSCIIHHPQSKCPSLFTSESVTHHRSRRKSEVWEGREAEEERGVWELLSSLQSSMEGTESRGVGAWKTMSSTTATAFLHNFSNRRLISLKLLILYIFFKYKRRKDSHKSYVCQVWRVDLEQWLC